MSGGLTLKIPGSVKLSSVQRTLSEQLEIKKMLLPQIQMKHKMLSKIAMKTNTVNKTQKNY